MKKLLLLICCVVLCGCAKPIFYPYMGDVSVTGDGGFISDVVPADEVVSSGLFYKAPEYKHDEVTFFLTGLPEKKKCSLLGAVQYSAGSQSTIRDKIAKTILELGGNVATKSSVTMPLSLDNNKGMFVNGLGGGAARHTTYTQYGPITTFEYVYNIFDCED